MLIVAISLFLISVGDGDNDDVHYQMSINYLKAIQKEFMYVWTFSHGRP